MKKPNPKKRNIILSLPTNQIKLSEDQISNETLAEVVFIGSNTEDYKVGEKVLFNKNRAIEIKHFERPYWKIHEESIICGVEYDSV